MTDDADERRTGNPPHLLIATLLVGGAASLSSTAFAAPTTTTTNITTDSDNPLLDAFSKLGKTGKIGHNGSGDGGWSFFGPCGNTQPQPPTDGSAGSSDAGPSMEPRYAYTDPNPGPVVH
ncbi:hypothetical protein ACFVFI_09500 [Streptomyces sp. NPDC057705]|uniref:hypothetical protein n=1 Tax=Streptomyces sp. NPDC057705 TaxID=3346222 RepID=UPI0036ADD370